MNCYMFPYTTSYFKEEEGLNPDETISPPTRGAYRFDLRLSSPLGPTPFRDSRLAFNLKPLCYKYFIYTFHSTPIKTEVLDI
jgi:hypothetical protein